MFVMPRITAPAARSRLTASQSSRAGSLIRLVPCVVSLAGDAQVVLDCDRHAEQRGVGPRRRAARRRIGLGERASRRTAR